MMTIPMVFQTKAMSIRLLSIALTIFVATVLVSIDNVKVSSTQFRKNEALTLRVNEFQDQYEVIPTPGGAVGPESFAFDISGGGPYTGVSDGRIIRWLANESRWIDFAVTSREREGCEGPHDHSSREHVCGRPLGLRFNDKTGHLYIADAYMGLLVVGPNGGLATPVTKEVDGVGFGFTNALDIDPNSGVVYFTDSSVRYSRRNHISVILSGDDTGRLMKFDTRTKKTTLLLKNLKFPNGVALSKNGHFLLFVETTTCTLFKFWVKTRKTGILEIVAQLPGFPDNIKRNRNGEFWIGINSRRSKFLEWLISNSWIGNALVKLPVDLTKLESCLARLSQNSGMGIKLNSDGNVVEVLDDTKGKRWKFVSEVEEENGYMWIGSVKQGFVLKEKIAHSTK